ncbi:MAG TPA: hypothetical protein VF390_00350 [Patescibacteria group bacterium]
MGYGFWIVEITFATLVTLFYTIIPKGQAKMTKGRFFKECIVIILL